MVAGLNAVIDFKNKNAKTRGNKKIFPKETIIGALADYISTENQNFQPMNANFGILPPLEQKIKDKQERYKKMAERSLSRY